MSSSRIVLQFCAILVAYVNYSCHIAGFEIHSSKSEPAQAVTDSKLDLTVAGFDSKTYNLKLTKAEKGVLHPNIKFFTLSTDKLSGRPMYDPWTPSLLELEKAENVFVDEQNKAVIRASQNRKGQRILEGTVDGMHFIEANGVTVLTKPKIPAPIDYIKTDVTLTYNQRAAQPSKYVLELAVVLDKAAGDHLGHDRQKLLNFWTVHFYDANLRYQTIPDTYIELKITSFTVIADDQNQKFYEGTQNEKGDYNSGPVLDNFTKWLKDTQKDILPKFDAGILLSAVPLTITGLAYVGGACTESSAVLCQIGSSYGNADCIAHELGHLMGAHHDNSNEASGPGGSACKPPEGETETGFVMGGNHMLRRFFFSECSCKRIHAYVTSDQAACMRQLDEPNEPVISEVIDEKLIPTILEQCAAAWIYYNGTNVEISPGNNANCTKVSCWNTDTSYGLNFAPLDGSPCEYGRCFRGRCISDKMAIIKNVETGKCLLSTDRFSSSDEPILDDCPKALTPLEKYYWELTSNSEGSYLKRPYSTLEGSENEDKCLQLSNMKEGTIKHVRCSEKASGTMWRFDKVDGETWTRYMILEAVSKKCLKQVGDKVQAFADCDKNDKSYVWEYDKVQN